MTYAIEYPTAVDANGNPTAWKTLPLDSDTTDGLTPIRADEFDLRPAGCRRSFPVQPPALLRPGPDDRGTRPPGACRATTILGDDYVNANGTDSGVIPVYDYAADANHTGYLTPPNMPSPSRSAIMLASRTRAGSSTRTMAKCVLSSIRPSRPCKLGRPIPNAILKCESARRRHFHGQFERQANPIPGIAVLESTATYSSDYSAMLGAIDRSIAPRWIMANTSNGGVGTNQVVEQTAATLEESAIRALSATWAQFTVLAGTVAQYQALTNPSAYLVLDSTSTGGSETDPRTQMATLAYYYLIGNPTTTFLMLWGGEAPATTWTQHWFNAVTYNVGLPEGGYSLFATGEDPSNTALTYNVYQRQYANALVLYKPLSYTLGVGTGTTANNTATIEQLGGTYQLLNADGTLGPPITSISLRNGEGAVLIKSASQTIPVATTTVASNPVGPLTQNEPVTFTAYISGGPSVGTVSFYLGSVAPGNQIGSAVNVSGGSATSSSTSSLPVGHDTIIAVYIGGSGFGGSQGSLSITVNSIPAPAIASVTINGSGTAAGAASAFENSNGTTATIAASGLDLLGFYPANWYDVSGFANQPGFNGVYTITATSGNTFSYADALTGGA